MATARLTSTPNPGRKRSLNKRGWRSNNTNSPQLRAKSTNATGPLVSVARPRATQLNHQGIRTFTRRHQELIIARATKAVSRLSLTPIRLHSITSGLSPKHNTAGSHNPSGRCR